MTRRPGTSQNCRTIGEGGVHGKNYAGRDSPGRPRARRSSAPTPSRPSSPRKRRSSASSLTMAPRAPATPTRSARAARRSSALLRDHMAPWLIGRDAADGRGALAGPVLLRPMRPRSARSPAFALAAIDTALWDLRCRKAGLPLHVMAGGAQRRIPLYTTEGGWLHLETKALVDDALRAKADGFGGAKIKVGRPHVAEDVARLAAVREAVGAGFEIMTDANQVFTVDEAIRRARALRAARPRLVRGAAAGRGPRRPRAAVALHIAAHRGRRVPLPSQPLPRVPAARRLLDRAGRCRHASAASRPG